jgi:hypothetical protein
MALLQQVVQETQRETILVQHTLQVILLVLQVQLVILLVLLLLLLQVVVLMLLLVFLLINKSKPINLGCLSEDSCLLKLLKSIGLTLFLKMYYIHWAHFTMQLNMFNAPRIVNKSKQDTSLRQATQVGPPSSE